jgi:spore germination cell wall hydrolase CwlJ-like protein
MNVSLVRTVVAVSTAICFGPWIGAAIPMISLTSAVAAPESTATAGNEMPAPAITFSIPKYTLTSRERDVVASCLVLEAASQGEFGMRGVMSVIRNRSRGLPELFATTVLQQKQFSSFNDATAGRESLNRLIRRAQHDPMWPVALTLVDAATDESWHDPTDGATHYTRLGEHTRWTRVLAQTTIIGRHAFYR